MLRSSRLHKLHFANGVICSVKKDVDFFHSMLMILDIFITLVVVYVRHT